jgi:competence protein ComEC
MLIDGGDGRREGTLAILRRLNALHIDKIDYLVATHADNDHCGGLSEVVRQKEILNAYLPPIPIEKAEGAYAEFIDELSKKDCEWKYASRAVSLNGTGEYPYVLSFLHPYLLTEEQMQSDEYAVSSNVLSTVIWLDYQGVSTLFTGDAPSSVEKLLMRDSDLHAFEKQGVQLRSTEILKVSHHGSADATTLGFLTFLRAKTAVISCGKDNLYGHPDEVTMKNLQTAKLDVYRTDEDGTVVITITNAGTYTVN